MDALKRIWDLQEEQQRDLGLEPSALSPLERRAVLADLLLGAHEELSDLQKHAGQAYKRHLLHTSEAVVSNVLNELADTTKLLVAIAQLHGITPAQLVEAVEDKTAIVRQKAMAERAKLRESTVLCVDMDDVICDMASWHAEIKKIRGGLAPGGERHNREESWKDEWYRSGRFAEMPPVEGASEALATVREWGWRVVIVTARPQWQYKRIHADTLGWLKRFNIHHDLILFGKDKVELIHQQLSPAWPVAFVEDYERNARALSAAGIHVLLFDRPHNHDLQLPNMDRVHNWREVMKILETKR
jgi:uncharacterized HAD superfamily protein